MARIIPKQKTWRFYVSVVFLIAYICWILFLAIEKNPTKLSNEIVAHSKPTSTNSRIMKEQAFNESGCFIKVTEFQPSKNGLYSYLRMNRLPDLPCK